MSDAALAAHLALALEPYRHYRRWWIACSGGVDSMVLLHALTGLVKASPTQWPPLSVIHVNHQIHPHAAQWAQQVARSCALHGIPCEVKVVSIVDAGEGLEAAARRARYEAFKSVVAEQELLLLAHHRDDQIETFFLRLLRGSGVAGLAGMPVQRVLGRGYLLRPLLQLTRADIMAYAHAFALSWVDDDSNADIRFDRNFLRQQVLPMLAQRWPDYRDTVARAVAYLDESNQLLQRLADRDLAMLVQSDGGCSLNALLPLPRPQQKWLLRAWLQQFGIVPGSAQLDQILRITTAAVDAQPCVVCSGIEIRRFQQALYAVPALPPLLPPLLRDFELSWTPGQILELPLGYGALRAESAFGSGLRADRHYRVCNRRGGERCHPLAREHSQTLKKLLQEAHIPLWWRDRVPLICCGDEIAAVGDFWVCRGFAAAPGAAGWVQTWVRPAPLGE